MSTIKLNKFIKGDVVELSVDCLGNLKGTIGVVYDEYRLGNHFGVSVIFPNSNYDGFSAEEQETFFTPSVVKHDDIIAEYNFTHTIRLSEHFREGKFKHIFDKIY